MSSQIASLTNGTIYEIIPTHDKSLRLEVRAGKIERGTRFCFAPANNSNAQQFKAIKNEDLSWSFLPVCAPGFSLDCNSSGNKPCHLWSQSDRNQNQRLLVEFVPNQGFLIRLVRNSSYVLEVGSESEKPELVNTKYNGSSKQIFEFKPFGNTTSNTVNNILPNEWNSNNNQVLVVAGDWAFNIAEKYGIYECQNKRTFRPSKYMAFYKDSQIDTLFEVLDKPHDDSTGKNTPEMASMKRDMPSYDDMTPRRVIRLKKLQKVGPIINDGKSKSGKTVPFTYGQPRYTTHELITKAKKTSELVHGIKGIEIIDTVIIPKKDEAKADILFVIDNSGSMDSYQKSLSSNVEKFIAIFSNLNYIPDFKLGICTTDSSYVKIFSKSDLLKDKNSFINSFKNSIMVGTSGSVTERGLEMALSAVKSFSRIDALLFVNIISDENDDSPYNSNYYVEQMKSHKGSKKVTINAIYSNSASKHYEAAKLTNGICAPINSDYGSLLSNIGQNVMDLIKTVPLSEKPNDETRIEVQRNKKMVSDWKYNSNLNSIDFTAIQKEDDVIDVVYYIDEKE